MEEDLCQIYLLVYFYQTKLIFYQHLPGHSIWLRTAGQELLTAGKSIYKVDRTKFKRITKQPANFIVPAGKICRLPA